MRSNYLSLITKTMHYPRKILSALVPMGLMLFTGAGLALAAPTDAVVTPMASTTTATENTATTTATATDVNAPAPAQTAPQDVSSAPAQDASSTPAVENSGSSTPGLPDTGIVVNRGPMYATYTYGREEIPPAPDSTPGYFQASFDTSDTMSYEFDLQNGTGITAAHLHCAKPGETGPAVVTLYLSPGENINGILAAGTASSTDILPSAQGCANTIGYSIATMQDLQQAIEDGNIYVNAHSMDYPDGVSRGQLQNITANTNVQNDNSNGTDSVNPNGANTNLVTTSPTGPTGDNSGTDNGLTDSTSPSSDNGTGGDTNSNVTLTPEQMDSLLQQFFQ
jgi:hypothetical protein